MRKRDDYFDILICLAYLFVYADFVLYYEKYMKKTDVNWHALLLYKCYLTLKAKVVSMRKLEKYFPVSGSFLMYLFLYTVWNNICK